MNCSANYLRNLKESYVFLEAEKTSSEDKESFLFTGFKEEVMFKAGDSLELFFKKLENYSKRGYWLAGYFSYEFGYFLEQAHRPLRGSNKTLLAWIGACKEPIKVKNKYERRNSTFLSQSSYKIKNLKASISQKKYISKIEKIKLYLKQGLTYQVNFTFKEKFDFSGDILDLYWDLKRAQPTAYLALIDTKKEQILSLSPELFFKINKDKITVRPMKGTVKRGLTEEEDSRLKVGLGKSEKIKSENLMIVDLLRNDLGIISKLVQTRKLFSVEKYRTLYQMTSTVEGKLKKNIKLKEIFSSLFPCGSVTGAPKIKTMELIRKLEEEPRGVYTGAIGYVSPKRKTCFNVAIRTIRLKGNKGELGVGGGIVYDSKAKDEYEEALLKAKFFRDSLVKVGLIESILWDKEEGYFLLEEHLKRLEKSAKYFSIFYKEKEIKERLNKVTLEKNRDFKIKLILSPEGKITIEKEVVKKIKGPVKIRLSSKKVNSKDIFLYHKVTKRAFYDREREKGLEKGYFETIFLNQRDELTQGAITNIFILQNKQLYTPTLKSGLLPGVLREHLLRQGKAKERTLYLKDIKSADEVYIGNSVRKLMIVKV